MASGTTVVFGASGRIGGIIAERLLGAGKRVRVVARSADRLAGLGARGAEIAAGDMTDAAFVREATAGAAAAFVLLPPWYGPSYRDRQARIAAALGDALEANGVEYAVALSGIGGERGQGTGAVAVLYELEQQLGRVTGLHRLILRPGYFFDNHLPAVRMVRTLGFYGSALRGDLPIPQIDSRDIGEVAARRLAALDWKGTEVLELQGPRDLTMDEATAALGKAIGKPDLRYVTLPYPEASKGLVQAGFTEEAADLFADMYRLLNEGLVRTTQPRSPATTTPTPIEAWADRVFVPAFRG